jgi:Gram-negative bacterial TonB protein C-terminal
MRMVVTDFFRPAFFALLAVWCTAATAFPQTAPSSGAKEGTIHPLLKWPSPEVISGTRKNPKYPRSAKKAGVGAELILQVQIDETGSVTSLGVTSTRGVDPGTCQPIGKPGESEVPGLSQKTREAFATAAADAILQWKYRPATSNGKSVAMLVMQVVRFCPKGGVMTLR